MKIFDPKLTGSIEIQSQVSGSIIPTTNETFDLGTASNRWNDIYLAGSTIDLGGTKLTKDSSGNIEFKDASNNRKKIIVEEILIGSGDNQKTLKVENGKSMIVDNSGDVVTQMAGHIMPHGHDIYDLGSPTAQWRDLYLSSGSLYIDGTQVISSTSNVLTVTTSTGQSLKLLETGADDITIQTDTGNIELKGTVEILSGKKLIDSAGTIIQFGDSLGITGSIEVSGTVDGIDLQSMSSSLESRISTLTGKTIISSSAQIATDISGSNTAFSASVATRFEGLTTDYTELDNIPNNIVSSSAQIASEISGSFTSASNATNTKVDSNTSNITSINAATSSYLKNTTDTLTGDLTVTGTITAQEFHTEYVSASVIYQSGSTNFGDTSDDIHNFTGSLNVDGNINTTQNVTIPATKKIYLDGGSNTYIAETATDTVKIYTGGSTRLALAPSYAEIFTTTYIPDYIIHTGDADSKFGFEGADEFRISIGGDLNYLADADGNYLYHNALQKMRTTSGGIYVTGDAVASSTILVGNNNSIFAENNLRFKSAGAAYIDHNTVGQSINFRTSTVSSLDTTPLSLAGANATFTGDITMTQSSGNNILFINSSGGGNPVIYMQDSTRKWGQFVSSGDLYFKNETTNVNTLILNGSNATFAGEVTVSGTGLSTIAGQLYVGQTSDYFGSATNIQLDSGASNKNVGIRSNILYLYSRGDGSTSSLIFGDGIANFGLFSNDTEFALYNYGTASNSITVNRGTNNVTFAGNVISKDTFYLENSSGKRWQQLFDGNNWNLRYYNGSNWSADALAIDTSNNATFGGKILVGTGATAAANINSYSTAVSTGLYSALRVIEHGTASSYWDIGATNAANTLLNFYHNGTTTPKISFTHTGGATFAGDIAVNGTNVTVANASNPYVYLNDTNAGAGIFQQEGNTTRIGSDSNTQVVLVQNNATAVTIDTNKNVGIGTTSPGSKLEIHKSITYGSYGPAAPHLNLVNTHTEGTAGFLLLSARYNNTSPAQTFYQVGGMGGGKETALGNNQWGGYINFFTTSDGTAGAASGMFEHMRITADGNVGIGNTSPGYKLQVGDLANTSSVKNDIFITGDTVNFNDYYARLIFGNSTQSGGATASIRGERSNGSNYGTSLTFYTNTTASPGNGSERMRIDSEGRVGIGTTNPANKLTVEDTIGIKRSGVGAITTLQQTGSGFTINAPTGYHPLILNYNGSEKARLNNSGNLGIGTTNPVSGLHISTNTTGDANRNTTTAGITLTRYIQGTDYRGSSIFHAYQGISGSDKELLAFAVGSGNSNSPFDFAKTKMVITESGNVGIGTTNPGNKLNVTGTGRVFNATSTNDEVVASITRSGTGAISTLGFNGAGSTSDYHVRIGANATHFVAFTSNTERLRITSAGNIGIGTTSPYDSKLQVVGRIRAAGGAAGGYFFGSQEFDGGFYAPSDGNLAFSTNNVERIRINGNGNVGLGTNNPSQKLHVVGTTNLQGAIQVSGGTFVDSARRNIYLNSFAGGDGNGIFFRDSFTYNASITVEDHNGSSADGICISGYDGVSFSTGANTKNERMRIHTNGNVGIGTTSPGQKLEVNTAAQSAIMLRARYNANYYTDYGSNQLNFTGTNQNFDIKNNGTSALFINSSSNIGIGTNAPGAKLAVAGDVVLGQGQSRPVKYRAGDGNFRITPNNGGWSTGYFFNNQSEAFIGGFGALGGTSDAFSYFWIGDNYNDTTMVIQPNAGNVGIGTTNPSQKLHVVGNVSATGLFYNGSGGELRIDNSYGGGIGYYADQNGHTFNTWLGSWQPRMSITDAGNVGIGTTSPGAKLDVLAPSSTTSPTVRFRSAGSYTFLSGGAVDPYHGLILRGTPSGATTYGVTAGDQMSFLEYGGDFRFYEKNSLSSGTLNEISRIHKTNSFFLSNVGIGTTTANQPLEIYKSVSGGQGATLRLTNIVGGTGAGSAIEFFGPGTQGIHARIVTQDLGAFDSKLIFQTKGTGTGGTLSNRLVINNSGDVNIGATFDFNVSTDLLTIANNQNTGGINLSGANSRIYFGGSRAIEGAQDGSNLFIGEGYNEIYLQDNTNVTGNLTVTGTLTAQEFKTELTTSTILYDSGSTKFGDTSDDNHDFTGSLNVQGNVEHTGLTMTSGTDIDQLYSTTKSMTLTPAWQDTGINGTDLATGTYVVAVYAEDYAVGGGHYYETYSGTMTWYDDNTNDTAADEIILHKAGHHSGSGNIYLRTKRTVSADTDDLKLQIAHTVTCTGDSNYVFKFRRLI